MPYATKDDLVPRRLSEAELAQLTSDDGKGETNTDVVDQVLAEASGKIDSYCRQRYAVPLQQSEQVKGLCLDLAVALLFQRKRREMATIANAHDAAIAFLKDVAAGKAALDQPAGAQPQHAQGGAVESDKKQVFDDDNLGGFIV